MTAPVLRLDNIIVRAGEQTLLDVPELDVDAGGTLALVGPNGAGKTTLLHVSALLRQPNSGTVTILGEMANRRNAATLRRTLSVVFQDPLLFDVTVLVNTAAGLRFQGWPRKEAERRARIWLERIAAGHLADRKARHLSGGEGARVALARAFATEPRALFLDEPFAAVDGPTRSSLLPDLRRCLQETGAAAVLVTHDRDEALAFGDRIAVMSNGRIIAIGEAASLIECPPSVEAANLLGIETILSARIKDLHGAQVRLALQPAGPEVRAQILFSEKFPPGEAVTVTIPAGAVRVVRPGETPPVEWNVLPGSIVDVTPLSSGSRLVVETPARFVAVTPRVGSSQRWLPGERVVVAFSPASAHVIPD